MRFMTRWALLALCASASRAAAQDAPRTPPVVRQPAVQAMPRGAAPTGFTATFAGPRLVRLGWTPAAGATGFAVYRASSAAGPWTHLATAPAGAASYDDATAAPDARYAYRVAARYAGKLEGSTTAAEVATPCDRYCPGNSCVSKPATRLSAVEGSVGTGAQWRLTIKVTAEDAETGAPLAGTVTINGVARPLGTLVTYPPCRGGRADDMNAEVVPCRAVVSIAGRGNLRLLAQ